MSKAASATDGASIISSAKDPLKKMWMETNWTNLSLQGQNIGLSTVPYYDPETMLLSKDVNKRLWRQLGRLYNFLGPDRAPHATPVLKDAHDIEWRSYTDGLKGHKVDIYDEDE